MGTIERIRQGKHHYDSWASQLQAVLQGILPLYNQAWVQVHIEDPTPVFYLHAAPPDIPRLIGRHNRTIEALTVLTKAWSYRHDLPARLEIPGAIRYPSELNAKHSRYQITVDGHHREEPR